MTSRRTSISLLAVLCPCLIIAMWGMPAQAAKIITCAQDDVRNEIDVLQLDFSYQATGLRATMSGLSVLGARVAVAPKTLQQAAVATQKLNEYIKALAIGYNSCSIGKQTYEEGINNLLPAMQSDGKALEPLRKKLIDNRKIDVKLLKKVLAGYNKKMEHLAKISAKSIDYERIGSIVDEQLGKHGTSLLENQKTIQDLTLARLDQLEWGMKTPLLTPQNVNNKIGSINESLVVNADGAEVAYNQGYDLLERYRFAEAIPYLEKAIALAKLPDFYLALGFAYSELPDLGNAERILRDGLAQVDETAPSEAVAGLCNLLGAALLLKNDYDEALAYFQWALNIDEKLYGPEHPGVARDAGNIGRSLQAKGDLDGALTYAGRALKIDEKVFGTESSDVAVRAINIVNILQARGDFEGALGYAKRVLKIDEKVFGPEHPNVARDTANVGHILEAEGDFVGALVYARWALKIEEKVFGPDYPDVAIRANNIGQILRGNGDLDGALAYTKQALRIFTHIYGPDNLSTKAVVENVEKIRSHMRK